VERQERPPWSALQAFVGDLRRTMTDMTQTQSEMAAVTGTAWSPDRLVKAVVGPRGQLIELDIDPRVFRTPNSKALSAAILATVRAAVEDANRKAREIMERAMPKDRGLGLTGESPIERMMASHDADLPQALRNEEDDGGHVL
jgi:DNA-binding protein YbaB